MSDGTLEQIGERWRIRFRRPLAHPAERVWQAITDPIELAAWFPQQVSVSGEWGRGTRLRFSDPSGMSFDGEVLRWDPPRLLEFTWGPDVLRFEIEPHGEGCMLVLADTFVDVGKAARDAAGWHVCLDALPAALAGTSLPLSSEQRWRDVHPAYVISFGPEAATEGPPA